MLSYLTTSDANSQIMMALEGLERMMQVRTIEVVPSYRKYAFLMAMSNVTVMPLLMTVSDG